MFFLFLAGPLFQGRGNGTKDLRRVIFGLKGLVLVRMHEIRTDSHAHLL
jgi:hypothetical protein